MGGGGGVEWGVGGGGGSRFSFSTCNHVQVTARCLLLVKKLFKKCRLVCIHQNDSCIKMGSDESHFNVSVGSDGQNHKTVSTNHNLSEEKGEPKRYRTEVLPLTSLTPNC